MTVFVCILVFIRADILVSVYEYVSAKLSIRNVGIQCKQWRSMISARGHNVLMAPKGGGGGVLSVSGPIRKVGGGGGGGGGLCYLVEKRICLTPPHYANEYESLKFSLTAKCGNSNSKRSRRVFEYIIGVHVSNN